MAIVCGGVRYDNKPTGMAKVKRKAKKKKRRKKRGNK
jgi:hypothetical protein